LLMSPVIQKEIPLFLTHVRYDFLQLFQANFLFNAFIKIFMLLVNPFVQYLTETLNI
jgi:hypothetical protein